MRFQFLFSNLCILAHTCSLSLTHRRTHSLFSLRLLTLCPMSTLLYKIRHVHLNFDANHFFDFPLLKRHHGKLKLKGLHLNHWKTNHGTSKILLSQFYQAFHSTWINFLTKSPTLTCQARTKICHSSHQMTLMAFYPSLKTNHQSLHLPR